MPTPEELEHEKWKFEQDRQIAERHHDEQTQYAEESNRASIENANLALRTLMLINGGAAVAVLAFLGGIIAADTSEFLDDLGRIVGPIVWFAWGVATATLGMGLAYITNYCITSSIRFRKHKYRHPYAEDTARSKRWERWAIGFQIVAVITAITSLGCFIFGMVEIRDAVVGIAP